MRTAPRSSTSLAVIFAPFASDGSDTSNSDWTNSTVRSAVAVRLRGDVALLDRLAPRDQREHRQRRHQQEAERAGCSDDRELFLASLLVAPAQLVIGDAERAGEQLEQRAAFAVGRGAQIGGERFGRPALEQRRREAAIAAVRGQIVGMRGRAVDDEQLDAIAAAEPDELADLLVHPARPRGVWASRSRSASRRRPAHRAPTSRDRSRRRAPRDPGTPAAGACRACRSPSRARAGAWAPNNVRSGDEASSPIAGRDDCS